MNPQKAKKAGSKIERFFQICYSSVMERDRFIRKAKKFVDEQILDKDIIDTLWIATVLGLFYFFKGSVEARRVRMINNMHRVRENHRISPLNPKAVKEVGYIVDASD